MDVLAWLEPGGMSPWLALPTVALLIAIDTLPLVGLAVPADVVVIGVVTVVGVCAGPSVIFAVIVGALIGWTLGYLLGRYLGHLPPGGHRWLQSKLARVSHLLTGHGDRLLMLAPFLPVINAFAPVAAGAADVGLRRTLAFAAVGTTAWASLYTGIGIAGREGLTRLTGLESGPLTTLAPLLIAVPVSILAAVLARRTLHPTTGTAAPA